MRYFLSYVVIQGSNTNQFGHTYSVLSALAEGDEASMEVVESVGFYGDPYTSEQVFQKKLFPAKLFGQGHLKQEHLRHIVSSKSYQHHHKTWEISEQEKDAWLRKVELDMGKPLEKRNFAQEQAYWSRLKELRANPTPENQAELEKLAEEEVQATREAGGAYFNLFKRTCMTDTKCRLNQLGISTKVLDSSWLDVPGWTMSPLLPMTIKCVEDRLVWKNPLVLTGRKAEDFHPNHWQQHLKQFYVAYQTLEELINNIKHYQDNQSDGAIELTQAQQRLEKLKEQCTQYVEYPQRVHADVATMIEREMIKTVVDCRADLKAQPSHSKLGQWLEHLVEWIQDRLLAMREWLNVGAIPSPRQLAQRNVERVSEAMEELSLRRQGILLG